VLTFEKWPYAEKRVVVLSTRSIDVSKVSGATVEHMSGSPAEITDRLAASGASHAYIDGGITVQRFLHARLIQRLIVTRVPVLIGEGIPLFGSLPHDVQLRHDSSRPCAEGRERQLSGGPATKLTHRPNWCQ
jgi:dihydrofolate reductase